jgi:hypothetical protein
MENHRGCRQVAGLVAERSRFRGRPPRDIVWPTAHHNPTDAWLYLCEFTYANSLAASYDQAKKRGKGTPEVPVVFIHVPSLKEDQGPYELLELTNILRGVC